MVIHAFGVFSGLSRIRRLFVELWVWPGCNFGRILLSGVLSRGDGGGGKLLLLSLTGLVRVDGGGGGKLLLLSLTGLVGVDGGGGGKLLLLSLTGSASINGGGGGKLLSPSSLAGLVGVDGGGGGKLLLLASLSSGGGGGKLLLLAGLASSVPVAEPDLAIGIGLAISCFINTFAGVFGLGSAFTGAAGLAVASPSKSGAAGEDTAWASTSKPVPWQSWQEDLSYIYIYILIIRLHTHQETFN